MGAPCATPPPPRGRTCRPLAPRAPRNPRSIRLRQRPMRGPVGRSTYDVALDRGADHDGAGRGLPPRSTSSAASGRRGKRPSRAANGWSCRASARMCAPAADAALRLPVALGEVAGPAPRRWRYRRKQLRRGRRRCSAPRFTGSISCAIRAWASASPPGSAARDRLAAGQARPPAAGVRRGRVSAPEVIKLAILAVGGQGGGVLTGWLVALAEANGWRVQSTVVAGVATHRGSTTSKWRLSSRWHPRPATWTS